MAYSLLAVVLILSFLQSIQAGLSAPSRAPVKDSSMAEFLLFAGISLFCVLFGGLMSGLTVGLLGIDEIELEMKLSSGTPEERINARKVLAVINHHHLLLVTLLLSNSVAMEALPLFLGEMFNTEITIAISVTFVLAFGEVIPQALCTGSNQLKIATRMIPLVKVLMTLLLPLSYPIAKLLDYLLDHNEGSKKLKGNDLKTFISLHQSFAGETPEEAEEGGLEKFQITMMHGIIDLNKTQVKTIMEPYKKFLRLEIGTPLTQKTLEDLAQSYYYIIPVFNGEKHDIVGTVHIHDLFKVWDRITIKESEISIKEPIFLYSKMSLIVALKEMESTESTIAFIVKQSEGAKKVKGVITKETILNHIVASTNLSNRSEIADISHALVGSLEKTNQTAHKKVVTPLRENFL